MDVERPSRTVGDFGGRLFGCQAARAPMGAFLSKAPPHAACGALQRARKHARSRALTAALPPCAQAMAASSTWSRVATQSYIDGALQRNARIGLEQQLLADDMGRPRASPR
uniref:Uncharacterized protein n=1 Tax=Haptolina ericina TaxID=156174 RepID=A0A7S3EYM8_9EUKA|mmetsp:Transcript_37645/g.85473  ORF Transcript_37645/g.85473 Transcript_37645/m.85473 type:complete len:111 (+) Transcript_37645:353-685(+)